MSNIVERFIWYLSFYNNLSTSFHSNSMLAHLVRFYIYCITHEHVSKLDKRKKQRVFFKTCTVSKNQCSSPLNTHKICKLMPAITDTVMGAIQNVTFQNIIQRIALSLMIWKYCRCILRRRGDLKLVSYESMVFEMFC